MVIICPFLAQLFWNIDLSNLEKITLPSCPVDPDIRQVLALLYRFFISSIVVVVEVEIRFITLCWSLNHLLFPHHQVLFWFNDLVFSYSKTRPLYYCLCGLIRVNSIKSRITPWELGCKLTKELVIQEDTFV